MTRLLVLWLLSERSSYGYEIKKALADDGTSFWFALEDASIYSTLRTLTKHGFATEVATEREGNRPSRTRYAITRQGRRLYRELLTTALAQPRLPVAPIDVALAARGDLAVEVVDEAIGRRRTGLDDLANRIEANRRSAPSSAIADRNLAIVTAERAWLDELDVSTIT